MLIVVNEHFLTTTMLRSVLKTGTEITMAVNA